MNESPYSSGDSNTNNVVQFGIYGYKKMGERLKGTVQLDWEAAGQALPAFQNCAGIGRACARQIGDSVRLTSIEVR